MLKQLEYSVTFPSTGKTLSEKIEFKTGFGTITGGNGAGKSFSVEALRWLLFGSAALRGKAEDYKSLKGTLTFKVKGVDYTINRRRNHAELVTGGEVLAVGTTPVNTKVVQILGFGLPVFDVACVSNQGDLEKLGTMKPTERKKLVDSVIGLGVIDDMSRWAGDEATGLSREASGIEEGLVAPIEPTQPAGFRDPAEIDAELSLKREALARLHRLEGTPHPGPEVVAPTQEQLDLQALAEAQAALPPAAIYTAQELDDLVTQWATYDAYTNWKGIDQPAYDRTQLTQMLDDHVHNERVDEREALKRRTAGKLQCPACAHEWLQSDDDLAALQQQIAVLPEGAKRPVPLSRMQIQTVADQWVEYEGQAPRPASVGKPSLTKAQIVEQQYRLSVDAQRVDVDWDGTDYRRLQHRAEAWAEANEVWEKAQAEIEALRPQVEGLDDLITLRDAVRTYVDAHDRYRRDVETYQNRKDRAAGLRQKAQDWKKVKEALLLFRNRVKQYLVPSLNRVASHYLSKMTNGVFQKLIVDEDFEVTVDGQYLNTMSGGEKHVANLALRLGLGQVLTRNIFSVFIGDEIDSFLDAERAQNTSEVLDSLKGQISQILLVTHKYPEADYYITIGENS